MPDRQLTARETLEIHLPPYIVGDERTALLDAYRDQVREEVAAEIDAAAEHTLATYPTDEYPAMSARVLGLRSAARIARNGQEASAPTPAGRLREAIRDTTVSLETLHDRLVFEHPDVADTLQNLIDQLSRTGQEG